MNVHFMTLAVWLSATVACAAFAAGEERAQAMMQRAAALKMSFAENPKRPSPSLLEKPILRCSDPTREEEDGTLWLWTDGKRPVALCCISVTTGKWSFEHSSLSDEALEVAGPPRWKWQPAAERRTWVEFDDPVPDSPGARKRAARQLAERLHASESHGGQNYVLRLLPQPLYVYADTDHGIADGSLFAFVNGTNPELIVQLEVREKAGRPVWQASFARLSAAEVAVTRNEKVLWSAPAIRDWNPRDGYYSVDGSDEKK